MKKRNYSIDLLKFYLALVVAVIHTPFAHSFPTFEGGYVVAMFFILSGYFLVQSYGSGKYATPWQYTMNRVKKLYPYYFGAFVIMFVYMNHSAGLRNMVLEFCRSLPELLMLQSIGIFSGGINYPLWQLSTLVVVGHILFGLIQWDRKLTVNVICPAAALLCYTYYIRVSGGAEESPFVVTTVVRAAAGLCLGMFLYDPINLVVKKLEESPWKGMPVFASCVSLFLILVMWTSRMSYGVLLPFVGLVIGMLYPRGIWAKLFQNQRWRWLDRLSLGIYVNHALIVRIFENNPSLYEGLPIPADLVYLAVLIPYCIVMMALVDGCMKLLKSLGKKAGVTA